MYYRPQSLAMTVSNVVEPVPPLGGFSRRDPIFFCRDFPVKSSTDLFPDWDVYGHIIMSCVAQLSPPGLGLVITLTE